MSTSSRHTTVTVNGLALHFLEWGKRTSPALVLLHGGSAHAHWWDHIAPRLAHQYRVLAIDLRGHGDSSWVRPPAYDISDYISDLFGLFRVATVDSPILVGHSLGGLVALAAAANASLCASALVLCDIGASLAVNRYNRLLRALGPPIFKNTRDLHSRFHLLGGPTHAPPSLIRHIAIKSVTADTAGSLRLKGDRATLNHTPIDLTQSLGRLNCPTLIMRGEESRTLSRARMEKTLRSCPAAATIEIPRAGHHLFLDEPDTFVNALLAFLRSPPDTTKKEYPGTNEKNGNT